MKNTFITGIKKKTNFDYTENGALTHKTTMSDLYDLFALGGAYRTRSDADCITLFKKAYKENPEYALKCLFYLRDILEGQGERRFFRVCLKWLAGYDTAAVVRNLKSVPNYARWDDLYCLVGTKAESAAFDVIKEQLMLDMTCKTPSLLAKWLKSENTSSLESRKLAKITREHLGMTPRQYRKTLSVLRGKINVLERLMSAGKWGEIEFDKIPSKAGLIYRNAFARHDVERCKADPQITSYEDFIKDENTKVNAKALYPYEVVEKAIKLVGNDYYFTREEDLIPLDNLDRLTINKYWDNLDDYFDGTCLNALPVVDTSGSMWGNPINIAISLGLYCAMHNRGPFEDHYISFSSRPQLIRTEGVDFCDKVRRIYQTNLCDNTNIEATFDLILNIVLENNMSQEDIPENLLIISDMEFDSAQGWHHNKVDKTLMESIAEEWEEAGYHMPHLVFWNVNARNDRIPMEDKDGITFVSGASPITYQMIMTGKTAQDLMWDKLSSERYAEIY